MLTFKEYIDLHPELYIGVQYKRRTGPNTFFLNNITKEDTNLIFNWFEFRYVVDDEKFGVYFRRVLNRDLTQYHELLELEGPWNNEDFKTDNERNYHGNSKNTILTSATGNESASREDGRSESDKIINNSSESSTSDGRGTTLSDKGGNSSSKGSDESHTGSNGTANERKTPQSGSKSVAKHIEKANPMSASNTANADGSIPSLDWSYSSAQSQDESSTEMNGKSDTSDATTTDEQTVTDKNTKEDTYKDSQSWSSTDHKDGSSSSNSSDERTHAEKGNGTDKKDISKNASTSIANEANHDEKGRTKEFGKVLNENANFVKMSSAWAWLQTRLEPCFLGVYEV